MFCPTSHVNPGIFLEIGGAVLLVDRVEMDGRTEGRKVKERRMMD